MARIWIWRVASAVVGVLVMTACASGPSGERTASAGQSPIPSDVATQVHAAPAIGSRGGSAGRFPEQFVAMTENQKSSSPPEFLRLGVFSSVDGRLIRWLTAPSRPGLVPLAFSPGGRWLYYASYPQRPTSCPRPGFFEPPVWRVRLAGGAPQRVGLHSSDLAFSPNGRMLAYTTTPDCGRTLLLVVVNLRTGARRTITVARNDLSGNGPIFGAQLSWAPDDRHLAVGTSFAAADGEVQIVDAWQATNLVHAALIPPCTSATVECYQWNPAFDPRGQLTLLSGYPPDHSWITRWADGHLYKLLPLLGHAWATRWVASDHTGTAFIWLGGPRLTQVWRWSGGRPRRIPVPALPSPGVTDLLWY